MFVKLEDMVLPFLSFSNEARQLRRYLDGVSDAIYIPFEIPFGFQTHKTAYVSCMCYLRHLRNIDYVSIGWDQWSNLIQQTILLFVSICISWLLLSEKVFCRCSILG